MIQKLEGLKTTLWSALGVSLLVIGASYSLPFWQAKLGLIEQVLWGLFAVTILFSAQFSRTRISLVAMLWLVFYLLTKNDDLAKSVLVAHNDWVYLAGVCGLTLLAFIKDRGMLSIHGVIRGVALLICVLLAKVWLIVSAEAVTLIKEQGFNHEALSYLTTELPLFIAALIIFWKSIRQPNLLVASLLTTLIIWTLFNNSQIELPLVALLALLMVHYLLVVVIDSYYLAYRDELTGIPSRRALNQLALSLGRKYTVAMLDVDHFKKFNDSYGHDIGDQVLKLVAAKLSEVKSGGRVFRYGGEEFTVVFPRKEKSEIIHELERLRQTIADYKIVIRHPLRKNKKSRNDKPSKDFKTVSVTISIGVATKEPKASFEQTVKQADQALYRAKKAGRNNVSH